MTTDLVPVDDNASAPPLPAISPDDRALLQEIAIQGSVAKAAQSLGITRQQAMNRLKKRDVAKHFDRLFNTAEVEAAARELNVLTGSAVGAIMEEAANAHTTKQVLVTCPQCHHTFVHNVQNIAYATKLKAAEMLMKFSKLLQPTAKVEVSGGVTNTNVNINIELTTPQKVAMERLNMGFPVPGYVYAELQTLAKQGNFQLPPNPLRQPHTDAFEGEFRVVEEDSNDSDGTDE